MTYFIEGKQHKIENGWGMSDAESSSEESEIESDTDSENDSGGSSENETSMPGPYLQVSQHGLTGMEVSCSLL